MFFIRSVRRRFSICAARAGEAFAASASAEAFPEQEKQDGDGREGCNPAEVRKLRQIVAPFFFLFHLQGALHGIIEMLDALLPLVERLLFSLLFCLIHLLYLISLLYRYLLGGRYPHTAVPPAYAAAGLLFSRRAVSAFSCGSGGRFCSYRAQHIVSLRLLSEVRSC